MKALSQTRVICETSAIGLCPQGTLLLVGARPFEVHDPLGSVAGRRKSGHAVRMRRILAVLAGASLLVGCSSRAKQAGAGPTTAAPTTRISTTTSLAVTTTTTVPPRHSLSGTFTVYANFGSTGPCDGSLAGNDDPDVKPGEQVTVEDGNGSILGLGSLDAGVHVVQPGEPGIMTACMFHFTVAGLPETAFYRVVIGQRAPINFSLSQVETDTWHVALTLSS
jgi:hypothetical protein